MTIAIGTSCALAQEQPAALHLAEIVKPIEVEGEFDPVTGTWSNRRFECASEKKHNEAM